MLTAKRRLKVLAKKGRLPLIPDMIKVPYIAGCVSFTATGRVFDPLIILPNKKTLRSLEEIQDYAYFASQKINTLDNKTAQILVKKYINWISVVDHITDYQIYNADWPI